MTITQLRTDKDDSPDKESVFSKKEPAVFKDDLIISNNKSSFNKVDADKSDDDSKLKESIKGTLSNNVRDVINGNEEEVNYVIEQLKNNKIGKEVGIDVSKLRTIKKSRFTNRGK
jgi:hypothetical protein